MNNGNCEDCGPWASKLDAGLCTTCAAKYQLAPPAAPVIGFTGAARSGKDTAADYLLTLLPGYVKASFADPLKDMARIGLGLSDEQLYGDDKHIIDPRYGCSPRYIMQTLGTEWGRDLINSEVWLIAMADRVKGNTLIPDVRFPNEANFVRERGILIHIVGRGGIEGSHKSEEALPVLEGDILVANDGDVERLFERLRVVKLCG